MRKSLKRMEKEFESLFEFTTDDKSSVTSVSCKLFAELFAEHCIDKIGKQYENEIDDLQGEIIQLLK